MMPLPPLAPHPPAKGARFESAYQELDDDPWGLQWRPSQRLRLDDMLRAVTVSLPRSPAQILDVGCATGDFTRLLQQHFSPQRVVGVDIAPTAVERARARFPEIDFTVASICEVGRKFPASFDFVSCLEVLYYYDDPAERLAALRSLKAALRPGGHILISSFIARPPYFSLGELRALARTQFEEISYGTVHMKPLGIVERRLLSCAKLPLRHGSSLVYRLNRAMFRCIPLSATRLLDRICRRIGSSTVSHGYIVGRLLAAKIAAFLQFISSPLPIA